MRTRMKQLSQIVFLALGLAVAGHAQTLGEITGLVTDPSGAVIPGARVTITNDNTNAARSTTTNEAGVYSVPSLSPGMYSARAEADGFQSVVRSGVGLQVQQIARINFEMKVGQVAEVIEVSGGAPLLTTEDATVGTVIENRRIVELPLNGRSYLQLVALSPNVSFGFAPNGTAQGRQGGARSDESISISGQRAVFNYFTLDGIDNTDVSYNLYLFLPSIDALQEFKVQTGIFPAEFGRATAQINVSTKSGTNQFHGALFEFLRNSALDANNYSFTSVHPVKDPFKRNQFGFTVGGPIVKDRLFFMTNYEGLRDRKGLRTVATVPDNTMRAGDFSGISSIIYDPASRQRQTDGTITATPFANNMIPSSRWDPKTQQLLEFYPEPNVPGTGLSRNYQSTEGRNLTNDQLTVRADWIESDNSTWTGRYSYSNEVAQAPQIFPQQGSKLETYPKQVLASNIRVLSASTVNEFRFGYSRWINENLNYNANVRDVVGELGGIPGIAEPFPEIYGIPQVGISGFDGFGDFGFLPFIDRNNYFQFVDNMSITRGKHTYRFGGEIRRDHFDELGNSFPRGAFNFDGFATKNPASAAGTGYSFADYMLGDVRTTDGAIILANTKLRRTGFSLFFDHTWKVRPKLTINMGLRYENTPPYYDSRDSMVNALVPSAFDGSQHPTLVRPGSGDFYDGVPFIYNSAIQTVRSNDPMGRRLIASDNNDLAPRLGIAYSPSDKWTFRAGAGAFYVQDTGNSVFDMGRNVAGRRRGEANNDFPDLSFTTPFQDLGAGIFSTPYVLANIYNRTTPYVLQYLFNIQRQLTEDTVLEVGYIGNAGHKIERMLAFNIPLPGPGPVASRRTWPELGTIQEVANTVNTNYNSLALKVTRRFSKGLTFVTGYTWSKAIDTGSGIRTSGSDPLFPQDNYHIAVDRGVSEFDVRHRFVTSFLWEVPFGKGRQFLNTGGVANAILGGWQLGSIITLQSGFPFTLTSGQDVANDGQGNYQRPDYNGQEWKLDNPDPQLWFNTKAFQLPALYTYGNSGRDNLVGPGVIGWDFSVSKNFRTTETQYLEFRFEGFNFPNRPNFAQPTTRFVSPSFGTIGSTASTMREIQFALKYVF
jgi:Carboxypeptidase regulatory-like domain